jgi:hypothetical protein
MSDEFRSKSRQRGVLFAHIANRIRQEFPLLDIETEFRSDSPTLIGWAYFLLSDAYKPWRVQAGNLTDDYKKAALSALAVMTIRPFSPIEPERVERFEVLFANPILAMAAANSWLSERNLFAHFGPDYLKRFYSSLLSVRLPSLQPFIDAVNSSDTYEDMESVALTHPEIDFIDQWVLIFHMLQNQRR